MSPAKHLQRKHLLWLWLLPAAVSWGLIFCFKPAGWMTAGREMLLLGTFCGLAGFALGWRSFDTFRRRLLGGLVFTGGSLVLVFSFAFLGCLPIGPRPMTPERFAAQRAQQEKQNKAWVARQLVPRDGAADGTMLDLSRYYDGLLGLPNNPNFRAITPGTQVWNGIKFDVRARVELRWADRQGIKGIPVGRKCSDLYFLHGAQWGMASNLVSQFVMHLAGGKVATLPIIYGRDVAGEYVQPRGRADAAPTNAVIWQERLFSNGPPPFRRFFISHWRNPSPELPVETIDFVPGQNGSQAYLVAITVKPAN